MFGKGIVMKLLVGMVGMSMLMAGLMVNAASAFAAGTTTVNSVALSSAAANATGVTATVSFKVATTGTVASVAVNLPNFSDGGSLSITNPTNIAGSTVTNNGTSGSGYTVYFNNTSASITAGTQVSFTINNLTNPSSNGNRTVTIKTWTAATGGGSQIDGGTTLVSIIANAATTLTATVSEALTGSVGASAISLTVDPSATAFQLATGYSVSVASNAKNGVTTTVSISGDLQGVAYGSGAKINAASGTFASPTSNTGKPAINTWGINADGSDNTWAGPTTGGVSDTGLTTTGPTNTVTETHVVGVNVDYTTPADTYTTTIYYVFTPNF